MKRLRRAWTLLNAPCREMSRLASESLDRDLDRFERIAIGSHRLYCRACRRYASQLATIRAAMARLAAATDLDDGPGPGLPADVRTRIERALGDQAPPA